MAILVSYLKVLFYTTFALIAFAFNSILCRLALRGGEADAAGFTAIRLASGAIALILICSIFGKGGNKVVKEESWPSAFFLFAYAACFSFAYLGLSAGTGALILFGSVQMTMLAISIYRGERPGLLEWLGLAVAIGGLVYLVFPGLTSPPLNNSLLMAVAGAAWGVYTLRGKGSGDPLLRSASNFLFTLPFAGLLALLFLPNLHLSNRGILLAVLSGAVASGIGYSVWYAALRHLTSTRAAVLQLAVPVIAAVGGSLLLGEIATPQLAIASALILGGIGMTIFVRKK